MVLRELLTRGAAALPNGSQQINAAAIGHLIEALGILLHAGVRNGSGTGGITRFKAERNHAVRIATRNRGLGGVGIRPNFGWF